MCTVFRALEIEVEILFMRSRKRL